MALSRQRARKCLINDSTRNTSIFTEKGKESFPKGKTLFNSTDSLMSKHFTHPNIPFSTAWFVKHDESAQNSLNVYYVNNKSMILTQYLKNLITRFIKILHWITSRAAEILRDVTSSAAEILHDVTSSAAEILHDVTPSAAEILHDVTSCCRNSARCNVVLQKLCTMYRQVLQKFCTT